MLKNSFLLRELATFTLFIDRISHRNFTQCAGATSFELTRLQLQIVHVAKSNKSTSTLFTPLNLSTGLSEQCLFTGFITRGIQLLDKETGSLHNAQ